MILSIRTPIMFPTPTPEPMPFNFGGRKPKTEPTLAEHVANLAYDPAAKEMANAYGGMDIKTVTWEDTARSKDSVFGPNISDMTLCSENTDMPVIRKPNFTDITCDLPIDHFILTVGNESDQPLTRIPLRDFLKDIAKFTGNPGVAPMFLDRDEMILTSTQACILPLKDGKVEFNAKLYNYQYDNEDPALLVIVANQTGTSVQAITKPNQPLFFNDNGKAANFVAQRLSDHRAETGSSNTNGEPMTQEEKDANMLFVFQIPLKQTKVREIRSMGYGGGVLKSCCILESCSMVQESARGFEDAIITTGEAHSEFEGTDNLKLVRDERFAIRSTIQYYGVTDTPKIPAEVFKDIAEKLDRVYRVATEKGSLVVEKDPARITEPDLEPPVKKVTKPVPEPAPSIF